ncbi:hypothetical protein BI364_11535 [Acidihalobacter yilgarnensis]|uniref:Serine aminopeptidase S33 domain-containing protein n=1 Tax=Acidihalobacter yilgarnensis TaxID=2819280 RepID=A0A1D8IPS2_9GAMM|nr:alpha/beta fold hydrolase [Acidihalobacter yilgarnensis]AOU98500.1 hypothetical protein BI364_11535 [Acidihalobacter yilgarnensis]
MSPQPQRESIQFTNARGERLAGVLHLPAGTPRASVLYAACFTCGKDIPVALRMGNALADAGFAMLRFDLAGLGESEGNFADGSFSAQVEDLLHAAAWLGQQGLPPQLLIGHSIGGGAVLTAAPKLPSVRAVATLAAPAGLDHLAELLRTAAEHREDGSASLMLGGRRFEFAAAFLQDLERHPPFTEVARTLARPLFVLHAPGDDVVPYAHGLALFEAAAEPRSFVSLDGADHLLRRQVDVNYVATLITGWATRHLEPGQLPKAAPQISLDGTEVLVRNRPGQRFTQDIHTPDHHWVADEPAARDGDNLGPAPYPLLLGALGACTAMTLEGYAAHKGWPLTAVTVRLEHRIEAERGAGALAIERHIELEGPLDAAQRTRLLDIANRCPVHRSLSSAPIAIRTELTPGTAEPDA